MSVTGGKIFNLIDSLNGDLCEYSPIPFWFLNDELTKEKLEAQMIDFKEKGVDGVVLHPRIGVPKELQYLSEEYFELLKHVVEVAARLNMKVVLYDEAMYPSGSAHGKVVEFNPEFASVGIIALDEEQIKADKFYKEGSRLFKIIAGPKDGKYIVQRPCGGTIRGIHFGEDDGEAGAPAASDILNQKAVDKFIELTHDANYEHLKEYFGTTIIGFFTDEPNVLGRRSRGHHPWSDGFLEFFTEAGGDVNGLWGIFEKQPNATTKLYRELIKQRLNDVYYKSLSDWCANHGIALMGHPAESADIDEEKYFHIPGQDLVFRWVSPELGGTKGKDSVMAKCSSDAARHMERRRNSNECFGVCSREGKAWYFTGGDMKWFIDWLGVRGVNLYIPHAFYYSLLDRRKDERPPDVGPGNIWWKHYKHYSVYMKRISYLMTDSKNGAKVAVLCESGRMPFAEMESFYENQIEFNYLQRCMLDKCEVKDGKLCIAGYEYDYIYDVSDNARIDGVTYIAGIDDVTERDIVVEPFCPKLCTTHLIKDGVDMYFCVNESLDAIKGNVTIKGEHDIVAYDLWTGKSYKLPAQKAGTTSFELELDGRGSLLIICADEDTGMLQFKPAENVVDITDSLELICEKEDIFEKTYAMNYNIDKPEGNEVFSVTAEEMVECWCNGSFVGVSFYNKHKFECGPFLKEGDNDIKLVVTGNAANRYTDNRIPYGIGLDAR